MSHVAIIQFPGTNRERDMERAWSMVNVTSTLVPARDTMNLNHFDAVILPGGFSYGDYLRPGAIAAHMPILKDLAVYAKRGGRILGVCNGFQILCESRLLPGALLTNQSGRFLCRAIALKQNSTHCLWTQLYQENEIVHLPLAHHSGRYFATPQDIAELRDDGRIVWTYAAKDETNHDNSDVVGNPNGSIDGIAGITNKTGSIIGIMPHPENAIASRPVNGITDDGLRLFKSLLS